MLIKISLIVSLCSGVTLDQVKAKMADLESKNPGAKITVRMDQKCKAK